MNAPHQTQTREPDSPFRTLEQNELQRVEGGVAPIYDRDGNVITCTDPRRSKVFGDFGGIFRFPRL